MSEPSNPGRSSSFEGGADLGSEKFPAPVSADDTEDLADLQAGEEIDQEAVGKSSVRAWIDDDLEPLEHWAGDSLPQQMEVTKRRSGLSEFGPDDDLEPLEYGAREYVFRSGRERTAPRTSDAELPGDELEPLECEKAPGEAEAEDSERRESVVGEAAGAQEAAAGDAVGQQQEVFDYLRPNEQSTLGRLEAQLPEREFVASDHVGHEVTDTAGRTYDFVGDPRASQFWDGSFLDSVEGHLLKSNDYTVVDVTGFSPEHVAEVARFLDGLPADSAAKIIKLGF
jgi:hypothetical protein